jgi:hypothetical protein
MCSVVQSVAMRLLAAVMASICVLTTALFVRAVVGADQTAGNGANTPVTVDELPEFLLTMGR